MIALALYMLAPAAGGALALHLWQSRPRTPKPLPPMAVYRRDSGRGRNESG